MSPTHDTASDLANIHRDLAFALGAAQHQASSDPDAQDWLLGVNHRVQRAWSQTVQRAGAGLPPGDLQGIPPVVEPDPDAPDDLDVEVILEHVAAYRPPGGEPVRSRWAPPGFPGSTRTAALIWCAAAGTLAVLLGVTVAGLAVVPAFVPPIAVALLVAWRGAGRVPGALFAIGLAPLALLLPHVLVSVAALAIIALIEGFAYLTYLSSASDGSWEHELRAQRRPMELELILYSLAAATVRVDVVALLVLACLAGLLWRRRWTAWLAAALTALALSVQLASVSGAEVLVYLALGVHWLRAAFHGPWLASRLSITEIGLSITGRAVRGSWRVAQRTVENALPPLAAPSRGGLFSGLTSREAGTRTPGGGSFGLRYCNTCLTSTEHDKAGFSLPICRRCVTKAGRRGGKDGTFRQNCGICRGPTQHTHDGKCLSCWRKGR